MSDQPPSNPVSEPDSPIARVAAALQTIEKIASEIDYVGYTFGEKHRILNVISLLNRNLPELILSVDRAQPRLNEYSKLVDEFLSEARLVIPTPEDDKWKFSRDNFKNLKYRLNSEWTALQAILLQSDADRIALERLTRDKSWLAALIGFENWDSVKKYVTPDVRTLLKGENHNAIAVIRTVVAESPVSTTSLEERGFPHGELVEVWNALRRDKYIDDDIKCFALTAFGKTMVEGAIGELKDGAAQLAPPSKVENSGKLPSAGEPVDYLSINHNLESKEYTHIIALVHGIKDIGAWQKAVSSQLVTKRGVQVVQVRYGHYPALRFLFPLRLHSKPVNKVAKALRDLAVQFPNAQISVIAHSFGTYVTLRALEQDPHIKLWKIIFCGSVADDLGDWLPLVHRIGKAGHPTREFIVNDCGTGDSWPVYGTAFGWFYGMAGSVGFSEEYVTNRFHLGTNGGPGGHSLYFDPVFVKEQWKPFLIDDEPLKSGSGSQGLHLSRFAKWLYNPLLQYLARAAALAIWLSPLIVGAIIWMRSGEAQGDKGEPPKSNHASREDDSKSSGATLMPVERFSDESPGLTRKLPGNLLLTGEVHDVLATSSEAEHEAAPDSGWLGHAILQRHVQSSIPVLQSAELLVSRYEPMPQFILGEAFGGMMEAIDVSFHLKRKSVEPPTPEKPWHFPATHYREYDPMETPVKPFIAKHKFTGITLTDGEPRDVRIFISSSDPGLYWIMGYLTMSDGADDTVSFLL